MNAIDKAAPESTNSLRSGQEAPPHRARLRYIDPLALPGADSPAQLWPALERELAAAARLGFGAAVLAPPWKPAASGDRFAPASLDHPHPCFGDVGASGLVERLAAAGRQHGLQVLLDLPLATLAADFDRPDAPYTNVDRSVPLDPRGPPAGGARHVADPAAAGAWWGKRLAEWGAAGIAGARVLGLDVAPGAFSALREAAPGAKLIAWTPGVAEDALCSLRGADYVVPSLPWWDGQSDWFWAEVERLRLVGPLLGCPEAPFGPRVAAAVHDPARLAATLRRAAGLACLFGDGWMVPVGFETGARRPMARGGLVTPRQISLPVHVDLAAFNRLLDKGGAPAGGMQPLAATGATVLAVLQTDAADARFARAAELALLNTDVLRPRALDPASIMSGIDGSFEAFVPADGGAALLPGAPLALAPGELKLFHAAAKPVRALSRPIDTDAVTHAAAGPRVAIELPTPCVDDGSLPVKRLVGELVTVEADVICDGHDKMGVVLRWHEPDDAGTHEMRMQPVGNDRFRGELPLTRIGAYEYTIEAWRDGFATFKDEIAKKSAAGVDVTLELREGLTLLSRAAALADGQHQHAVKAALAMLTDADDGSRLQTFLSPELAVLMEAVDDRPRAATLPRPVRIDAERSGAAFSAWYEVFPRSMSDDATRHGTFRDVENHLPRIRAMGFDVLYFPPISPIGQTNRKGPNNTLTPAETDPGSPYAIGSEAGGHDAIHPELGTLEDFRHLLAAAATHGIEIAIDFAIQCSPDHPWLKQHRGWFDWRPDGSIKYAENPPKKYQDIVNVDFYAADAVPGLWTALAEAVLFWCEQGVRLFRVDNPHTKPLPFWRWMIDVVRRRYPDAVFLAEAFTRPKVMYRLAKVGFSQSYTYFTWRETKREMEQYLTELAAPGPRDFFRPHFFVNTPDINPVYLQNAGRSSYLIRAALAATLSGLWGVYCGFELCEGTPLPGREEYRDSEKYQIRAWDWHRPGNIVPEITALNRIRRANPALRSHLTTTFLPCGNDVISMFMKATPDRTNVLVVAISFDPNQPQESGWEFPFWTWQASETAAFEAEDLFTGARTSWRGKNQFVRLESGRPYTIWRVRASI